jgi:hypothetical protein
MMPQSRQIDHEGFEVQRARSDQPSMWDGYVFGKPGAFSTYFNDFHQYLAGDWTITTTEAGAGSATEAITDETGGVLLLTNAAGDDDLDSLQLVGESFLPAAGKRIYFETRVKISDATDTDALVGLVVTDTSPLAHANGIVFRKDDDDTNWDFASTASSVSDEDSGIATATTGYIKLGFKVTGTGLIEYYVNDVKKGETNTVPTTEMRITMHIQNGTNVAKTMSIDYIFAAQER